MDFITCCVQSNQLVSGHHQSLHAQLKSHNWLTDNVKHLCGCHPVGQRSVLRRNEGGGSKGSVCHMYGLVGVPTIVLCNHDGKCLWLFFTLCILSIPLPSLTPSHFLHFSYLSHLLIHNSFIDLLIHALIRSLIHLYLHTFIHPFIQSLNHPSVHSFYHLFIYPLIQGIWYGRVVSAHRTSPITNSVYFTL